MSRLFAAAGACAALLLTIAAPTHAAPGDRTTPIQHLVVVFDENVSFDHYFATYPNALNTTAGEPVFSGAPLTSTIDNLQTPTNLLTGNPNSQQPARLARSQSVTCDQKHNYDDEQKAFH